MPITMLPPPMFAIAIVVRAMRELTASTPHAKGSWPLDPLYSMLRSSRACRMRSRSAGSLSGIGRAASCEARIQVYNPKRAGLRSPDYCPLQEGVDAAVGGAAEAAGHAVEAVHAAGVNGQLGLVARGQPALVHEQRVVQQRVERANGEQRRRQIVQIRVERRDV